MPTITPVYLVESLLFITTSNGIFPLQKKNQEKELRPLFEQFQGKPLKLQNT